MRLFRDWVEPFLMQILLGIIPTVFVMGPFALLAALLPAVFGGLQRRWLAFLSVVSLNCTLYVLAQLGRPWLKDSALADPRLLWWLLALVDLAGVGWAWRRQPRAARSRLSAECVLLALLTIACATVGATTSVRVPASGIRIVWAYEPPERGFFDAAACVSENRIYVAAAHVTGTSRRGAIYCLDRATGRQLWKFDADNNMRPVFSSPRRADGRLYVGEGFHEDADCRLFCLNADTGAKLWEQATASHVESTPCIAGGRIYVGAGGDGLICLEADSGKKLWHFRGLHVDSDPALRENRLYAGSTHGRYEAFCLDAATGEPVWRTPLELPVSSAALAGERVYFGFGNGSLLAADAEPRGGVVCLDARTGKQVWRRDLAAGVYAQPHVEADRVYFGAGDGNVYCLDGQTGTTVWRTAAGAAIVAALADSGAYLYGAARNGKVSRLAKDTGQIDGSFEVPRDVGVKAQILAAPVIADEPRRIFIAASLGNFVSSSAVLFCFAAPENDRAARR